MINMKVHGGRKIAKNAFGNSCSDCSFQGGESGRYVWPHCSRICVSILSCSCNQTGGGLSYWSAVGWLAGHATRVEQVIFVRPRKTLQHLDFEYRLVFLSFFFILWTLWTCQLCGPEINAIILSNLMTVSFTDISSVRRDDWIMNDWFIC